MVGELSATAGQSVQARRIISPWSVGVSEDLQLDTATVAGAADPKADAPPQRG